MDTVKIGECEASRFILGSNPFYGFSHQSEALDREMREYFTDERICALMDEAADHGITAVASPVYERCDCGTAALDCFELLCTAALGCATFLARR